MSTQWDILINEIGIPRDVVMHCIRPFMGISEAEVRKRYERCLTEFEKDWGWMQSRNEKCLVRANVKYNQTYRDPHWLAMVDLKAHFSVSISHPYGKKSVRSTIMQQICPRSEAVVAVRMRRLIKLLIDNYPIHSPYSFSTSSGKTITAISRFSRRIRTGNHLRAHFHILRATLNSSHPFKP